MKRPEFDLAFCSYYRGAGVCDAGCREEPSCMTDRPREGWPSEGHPDCICPKNGPCPVHDLQADQSWWDRLIDAALPLDPSSRAVVIMNTATDQVWLDRVYGPNKRLVANRRAARLASDTDNGYVVCRSRDGLRLTLYAEADVILTVRELAPA